MISRGTAMIPVTIRALQHNIKVARKNAREQRARYEYEIRLLMEEHHLNRSEAEMLKAYRDSLEDQDWL